MVRVLLAILFSCTLAYASSLPPVNINISGTVYSDQGVTNIGAGITVSVSADGAILRTTTTNASGYFTLNNISVQSTLDVTVFINDEAVQGSSVGSVGRTSVTDFDIYQDTLLINRSSVSDTLLDTLDTNGDPDLLFAVVGNTLTINAGVTMATSLSFSFVTSVDIAGDVRISGGGLIGGAATVSVGGDFLITGGFYGAGTSTLRFTEAATFQHAGRAFYNVTVDSGPGQLVVPVAGATLDIRNNLTVASGSFNTNSVPLEVDGSIVVQDGGEFITTPDAIITAGGGSATANSTVEYQNGNLSAVNPKHSIFNYSYGNLAITGGLGFGEILPDNDLTLQGDFTIDSTITFDNDKDLSVGSLTITSGGLTNTGTGDLILGGAVSNAGTINFDGSNNSGNSLLVRSTAPGTARNWQGAGTFNFTDVSVQDQTVIGGTPVNITTSSSWSVGGNTNWIFDNLGLSGVSLALANNVQTRSSTATVGFTLSNPLPGDGKVAVTFPAGFDVSGVTAAFSPSLSGTLGIDSAVGQTVVLRRIGGQSVSGTVSNLRILGVVNPAAIGATGAFNIETRNSSDGVIDTGVAPGVTIAEGFSLGGIVRDDNGTPLSGVTVDGGVLGTVISDSNGAFSFGLVARDTNFTLSYDLINYDIPDTSVNLSANANLTVSGEIGGALVRGVVTLSNQDRTPLAGVTVTDGVVSTVTASDGSFLIGGVGDSIRAELDGFKFEEPVSGFQDYPVVSPSAAEQEVNFVASPGLGTVSYSAWNTFLDMTAILELSNNSDVPINLVVELKDALGVTVSGIGIDLAPRGKRDLILNDILNRPNEYGLVKVTSSSTAYSGGVTQYRTDLTGAFEFAYTVALSAGMTGEASVPFNSNRASSVSPFLVSNWLTIINLSNDVQGYQVLRYRFDGFLERDETFFIAANGRADLSAGHQVGEVSGHIMVRPLDSSAEYMSFLTRYGDSDNASYAFATNIMAGAPSSEDKYLEVSKLNGASTWFEITNTSDFLEQVSLTFYEADGTVAWSEVFGLPAKAQRHYGASNVLAGDYGYARISTLTGEQVMVQSLVYFADATQRVTALSNIPAKDAFGRVNAVPVNSFINIGNILKVSNISDRVQSVTITTTFMDPIALSLAPNSTQFVPLSDSLPPDIYAEVTVFAAEYGTILTEVTRAQGAVSQLAVPNFALVSRAR